MPPDVTTRADRPLAGRRIGVTAARKVEEQSALLERRGAEVVRGSVLAVDAGAVAEGELRATTERVLAEPVDVLVATTGIGVRGWFAAAERWGLRERLVAHLGAAEVLARGPKSAGALRQHGLRERWSPASEALVDVLGHLGERDLTGTRVVLQEHGEALDGAVARLRAQGAEVVPVAVYRVVPTPDTDAAVALLDRLVGGDLDAVTFTSAMAVDATMRLADGLGLADAVAHALGEHTLAVCVGAVTASAFEPWGVPTVHPERMRLVAMVDRLEDALARGAR